MGARKRSGSAGVESSDDEADSEDEREHKSSTAKKGRRRKEEAESLDDDDDEDGDDDGDAYGEDEFGADQDDADDDEMESADEFEGGDTSLSAVASKSAGMAGAMTRILGVAGGSAAVLSKTKTPLQKLQEKQKSVDAALREKRRERRDTNLTAMHVPLSAATSRPLLTSDADGQTTTTTMIRSAIAQELEEERAHRRVATRGVVALFNAISKHQDKMREDASAEHRAAAKAASASGGGSKSAEEVKVMSKRGFLDLLKTNATKVDGGAAAFSNKSPPSVSEGAKDTSSKPKTGGWNALKDDYMMTSKLKDWDKELTDEEDSDDDDDDEAGAAVKRQRVKA